MGCMIEPTSACSPGSEDSTSPPKPSVTDAPDRSNGTDTAPLFSNEAGPESHGGEISTTSPLLHTPTSDSSMRENRYAQGGAHLGHDLAKLLPTPRTWDAEYRGKGSTPQEAAGKTGRPLSSAVIDQDRASSSEGSPASPPAPPVDTRGPQMTAGSGPSSPVSLASWDRAAFSWRTFQASLLSTEDERFPRSSERWPTSGMTRRGQAFALPMLARPTTERESSSLLRTPMANENNPATGGELRAGIVHGTTRRLPTPTSRDHKGRNQRDDDSCLTGALLPTPVADHSRGLAEPGTDYASLPNAVLDLPPTPRVGGMSHGYGEAEAQAGDPKHRLETRIEVLRRSPGEPTNPLSEGGKP